MPPTTPPEERETKAPEQRQFVDITPAELVGLFEGHTTAAAVKLAEPYIGKWMKVSGPLGDVLTGRQTIAQVTFQTKSVFDPGREWFDIYMYFDRGQWDERLAVLRPGNEITVVGRLHEASKVDIHLEDCELVDE